MANKIFIDTGAFIALNDKSDQYHLKATAIFKKLLKDNSSVLFTSNLVISETYTRILYISKPEIAIKFLDIIKQISISILYSDHQIENKSIEFLKKYKNEKISYTDAVSFLLMKENKISKAFAFDRHFLLADYILLDETH
ncbi:MAG: hypothetical protein A2033_08835 [Bacteroidetes bacterium GWA2_31_9]|nr:MAG: hypothetical protein A2033_08835 [Bacteroidetes bacterium GWA2_31_9]